MNKIKLLLFLTSFYSSLCLGFGDYPFYDIQETAKDGKVNNMRLIHNGLASLALRIDMIRRAEKEIVMEYFIWERDLTGKILLLELMNKSRQMKKAKKDFKIRIIVDKSITVIALHEYYAEVLKKYDIEVAYHNRAVDPLTAQFRDHRKLIVIDSKEAITGGRNIGDDYFDMDKEFNFLDRDIWVEGPIAKTMKDSFDAYWNHYGITKKAESFTKEKYSRLVRSQRRKNTLKIKSHEEEKRKAREFFKVTDEVRLATPKIMKLGMQILKKYKTYECPKTTYATDLPGGKASVVLFEDYSQYRVLRKEILSRINNVKEKLYIESPYWILNKPMGNALKRLLDDDKEVTTLTNSLNSTDAVYMSALFYDRIFVWEKMGLRPYVYNANFLDNNPVAIEEVKKQRWGLHAKTMIFDDESIMIGTYNIDNRSDYFNNEMSLFCDGSKELVDDLKANIAQRMNNAYELTDNMKASDQKGNKADIYGGASAKSIRGMKLWKLPAKIVEPIM